MGLERVFLTEYLFQGDDKPISLYNWYNISVYSSSSTGDSNKISRKIRTQGADRILSRGSIARSPLLTTLAKDLCVSSRTSKILKLFFFLCNELSFFFHIMRNYNFFSQKNYHVLRLEELSSLPFAYKSSEYPSTKFEEKNKT